MAEHIEWRKAEPTGGGKLEANRQKVLDVLRELSAAASIGGGQVLIEALQLKTGLSKHTVLEHVKTLQAASLAEYHIGKGGKGGGSWARPLDGPREEAQMGMDYGAAGDEAF